ncbi:MAG: DUF3135 domain-containing protein [Bermanella sp.]
MYKSLPSYEELREMAQKDPEALERLRLEHVRATINSAPEAYRQRLSGLQFQIDGQRRLAKSPLAACLRISKMMHDSLHELKAVIEEEENAQPILTEEAATVLAFPS